MTTRSSTPASTTTSRRGSRRPSRPASPRRRGRTRRARARRRRRSAASACSRMLTVARSTCGASRKCSASAARVGLDRAVEMVLGERVGRVLHRVGGDDERVVAVGVGGREVALERDRDGQVAESMAGRARARPGRGGSPPCRSGSAPSSITVGPPSVAAGQSGMPVAGDVDDGVEGAVELGVAVGRRAPPRSPGSSAARGPAGDEDAVAEPEPRLVRRVEVIERRREVGDVAVVVALLGERQRRDARRAAPRAAGAHR